jgi:hypothetical protein
MLFMNHNKWFFLLFVTLLFSCQDKKKEQQLEKVVGLINTTDSIRTIFIENRNDSLMYYIQQVMDVEFRIRRSYNSDTIDVELSKKMNAYKMVRKKLKPILKNNAKMETGTLEELATLKKLKSDIENGAGNRSKYETYIAHEQNKVNQLKLVLNEIIETQEKEIKVFNDLHKELYEFSMQLEHVIK